MNILKRAVTLLASTLFVFSSLPTVSSKSAPTKVINIYVKDTTYKNSAYDRIFDPTDIVRRSKSEIESKNHIQLIDKVDSPGKIECTSQHENIRTDRIGTFNYKGEAYYKGCTVVVNIKLTVKPDYVVNIPDKQLDADIRAVLLSKHKSITRADLDSVTMLSIKVKNNNDINPDSLKYLSHLSLISLDGIKNIDTYINKLKGLKQLNDILVSNSQEDNFKRIGQIPNLRYVTIDRCNNIKLDYLADGIKNKHIISLAITGCGKTDITQLSKLNRTGIIQLNLYANKISSLEPIENLKSLTSLMFQNNGISDLKPISSLTGLTYLNFQYNKVADLSPLSGLKSLKSLLATGNNISDIASLSKCSKLCYLDLSSNFITDITALKGKNNIESLSFESNYVSDISVLRGFTHLKTLKCDSNQITDYSAVKAYYNKLSFKDFKLTNSSKITKLKKVTINKEAQVTLGEQYDNQPMFIAEEYLTSKGIDVSRLRATEWKIDTSKQGKHTYSGVVEAGGYLFSINLTVNVVVDEQEKN